MKFEIKCAFCKATRTIDSEADSGDESFAAPAFDGWRSIVRTSLLCQNCADEWRQKEKVPKLDNALTTFEAIKDKFNKVKGDEKK